MNALKNIIRVTLSNVTTILSGVLVGFLVPKVLSLAGYGYYKTFTLYVSYLGLFSLGMVDGIVLKYGDKDYHALDRGQFRSFYQWFMLLHMVMAGLLVLIAMGVRNADSRAIIVLLGLNLIAVNAMGYFQQISQITQRFKEYSFRKIVQSAFNVVIVILMYVFYRQGHEIGYQAYILSTVLVNYLLLAWYLYTYRDIVFGRGAGLKATRGDVLGLMRLGFPLLFANMCSTLLLTIDRQFVSIFFTTEEYAVYAFAYNMLSLVTVATSAISTVLYPMLKRTDADKAAERYPMFVGIVLITVYVIIAAYFPLTLFIRWFLPKYSASLPIFRIILPGIALSSVVTVVMHNYYKIANRNKEYFRKSVVILLLSIAANFAAYWLVGTMESISAASILTVIVWYLYVDGRLKKDCRKKANMNFAYAIVMLIAFYACTGISNVYWGCAAYIAVCAVMSLVFYRDLLKSAKQLFR